MISELDLTFVRGHGESHALAWIIDGECLYDLALNDDYAKLFLFTDKIEDISGLYPDNAGLTLRFFKDEEILEEININEYFGSILLSTHKVINLMGHAYGDYVTSPYANFINNEFIVSDQDMTTLEPFYNGSPAKECTQENCHCYKADNV
jgi:hypothetical protein